MKKRGSCIVWLLCVLLSLSACKEQKTEVYVFAASSLNRAVSELAEQYCKEHPEIEIVLNTDSSGALAAQIQEGFACDIFFPADTRQMEQLAARGLVEAQTEKRVLENQLVLVSLKNGETQVEGLDTLDRAGSIALAGGSVPAGRYTRCALVNLGMLPETEEISAISGRELSEALGGVEISEQDNVSKVLIAVLEGVCEVGTVYRSDLYGYEEELTVLEAVNSDLTGEIVYPICRIVNPDSDEKQKEAAEDFMKYMLSEESGQVFCRFGFEWAAE